MKNKINAENFKLFLIPLILVLMIIPIASATLGTVTINQPAQDAVIKGVKNITVTIGATPDGGVMGVNFTLIYNSNSTQVQLYNQANTTGNWSSFSYNWRTNNVSDAADYQIRVTAFWGNNSNLNATNTGIDINNGNPTCSCTRDKTTLRVQQTVLWDCRASTDTVSVSNYSLTLTKPDSTTATSTLSNKEFVDGDLDQTGEYTLDATVVNNGAASNACTAQKILVYSSETEAEIPIAQQQIAAQQEAKEGKQNVIVFFIVGAIVLLILITIIVVAIKKSQK